MVATLGSCWLRLVDESRRRVRHGRHVDDIITTLLAFVVARELWRWSLCAPVSSPRRSSR